MANARLFRSIIPGFLSRTALCIRLPTPKTHARPLDQGSATDSRQKPISPFCNGLCLITNHVSPAHWLCLFSQSYRVLPTTTTAGSSKSQCRLSLQTSRVTPLLCLLTTLAVFACWCPTGSALGVMGESLEGGSVSRALSWLVLCQFDTGWSYLKGGRLKRENASKCLTM